MPLRSPTCEMLDNVCNINREVYFLGGFNIDCPLKKKLQNVTSACNMEEKSLMVQSGGGIDFITTCFCKKCCHAECTEVSVKTTCKQLRHPCIPHKTCHQSSLHNPKSTTDYGRHTVLHRVMPTWNSIPHQVTDASSIIRFKKQIKIHLMEQREVWRDTHTGTDTHTHDTTRTLHTRRHGFCIVDTVHSESIQTPWLFQTVLCYSLKLITYIIFLSNLHTIPHNDKAKTCFCCVIMGYCV